MRLTRINYFARAYMRPRRVATSQQLIRSAMAGLDQLELIVVVLRSIATAASMAGMGGILALLGLLDRDRRKGLAAISAKFTIPCLLFTSILNCTQNFSIGGCTNIIDYLHLGWPLLLMPVFNVASGVGFGCIINRITKPPESFRRSVSV